MGSPTPRKSILMPDRFPVRLVVAAEPAEAFFAPRGEVEAFLRRRIGQDRYMIRRSRTETTGRTTFVIYLVSLGDAQALLLGCPQLQLVREVYQGRMRG